MGDVVEAHTDPKGSGRDWWRPVSRRGWRNLAYRLARFEGLLWIASIFIVLGIGIALSWWFWDDLRGGGQDSLSTTVRNVALVVGGVVALFVALWRSRVAERQAAASQDQSEAAQRQANTAQQGLLNERYQRATEMLGSEVLSVRLGGITALQRLAQEHPQEFHTQVMQLFCAFARNPTGSEEKRGPRYRVFYPEEPRDIPLLREDVQAVLSAIGSRGEDGMRLEMAASFTLDLYGVDIGGASLAGANLSGADLQRANLVHAGFQSATLSGADLQGANLHRAFLSDANLSRAKLGGANLSWAIAMHGEMEGANLAGANLSKANFTWANLSGVNFGHADLSAARLDFANLSGARFGKATRTTLSSPPVSEEVVARLTQSQLDEAVSDPGNPPEFEAGVVDIETDEPLVWRGRPIAPESRIELQRAMADRGWDWAS